LSTEKSSVPEYIKDRDRDPVPAGRFVQGISRDHAVGCIALNGGAGVSVAPEDVDALSGEPSTGGLFMVMYTVPPRATESWPVVPTEPNSEVVVD
jgi:hypothetical protein